MSFLDAMDVYFRGERVTGLALVPIGLLLVGVAVYLFHWYGSGFGKAMGTLLGVAGIAAAIGGPFLAKTVSDRASSIRRDFADDPAKPVAAEQARIAKVNQSWATLKWSWTGLMIIGLGLLAVVKRDWVQGAALALICLCAVALVVDVIAERRARVYATDIAAHGGAGVEP